MICEFCKKELLKIYLFCPYCGKKIVNENIIPKIYKKLYGKWEVTTEGNDEGISIKTLGVFEGW